MVAVDTNVLVRLLTGDQPVQYKANRALFATQAIFIPDTVILATEWVLRAAYELESAAICEAFHCVFGHANVTLGNAPMIARVIDWHEAGLDFADAFHLALSQDHDAIKTFDATFIKRGKALSEWRVEKPCYVIPVPGVTESQRCTRQKARLNPRRARVPKPVGQLGATSGHAYPKTPPARLHATQVHSVRVRDERCSCSHVDSGGEMVTSARPSPPRKKVGSIS